MENILKPLLSYSSLPNETSLPQPNFLLMLLLQPSTQFSLHSSTARASCSEALSWAKKASAFWILAAVVGQRYSKVLVFYWVISVIKRNIYLNLPESFRYISRSLSLQIASSWGPIWGCPDAIHPMLRGLPADQGRLEKQDWDTGIWLYS